MIQSQSPIQTVHLDVDLAGDSESPPISSQYDGEITLSGVKLTVDLTIPGKQHGHLILPNPSELSAYGTVQIPVCVLRGGDGPTITMVAGVHGDEFEGPMTLLRLARNLDASAIQGCLILIPSVNLPAVQRGSRQTPQDGRNLDRCFGLAAAASEQAFGVPGNSFRGEVSGEVSGKLSGKISHSPNAGPNGRPNGGLNGNPTGSLSERMAHAVLSRLIMPAELVIDLRSGGQSLQFAPSAAVRFDDKSELQLKAESSMIAFGAPNSVRLSAASDQADLYSAVTAAGIAYMQTELGGGGSCSAETLDVAYTGCRNVLSQMGVLQEDIALRASRMLEVRGPSAYVYAQASGLLEPAVRLGHEVWHGNCLANIINPTHTGAAPVLIPVPRNGVLLAVRHGGRVSIGDCIAIIADEVPQ